MTTHFIYLKKRLMNFLLLPHNFSRVVFFRILNILTPLSLILGPFFFSSSFIYLDEKTLSLQENLHLKKIEEFWKDQDVILIENQIKKFLSLYPQSDAKHLLYTMLGDLYFINNRYSDALNMYAQVKDDDLQDQLLINQMWCLFERGDYQTITATDSLDVKMKTAKQEEKTKIHFLLGHSLHRQALLQQDLEQQKVVAIKAEPHLEVLKNTRYQIDSLFALAEIKTILRKPSETAEIYSNLASMLPQQREELLFQAAYFTASFDKISASKLFAEIVKLREDLQKEAFYNQVLLLFQVGDYDQVLELTQKYEKKLPEEKKSALCFLRGSSYFAKGQYTQAASALKTSFNTREVSLKILNCAVHLEDLELFEKEFEHYKTSFSNEEDYPKLLHLLSQRFIKSDRCAEAQTALKQILDTFPTYEKKAAVYYEYATLLKNDENWTEARKIYLALAQEFPNNIYCKLLYRHILDCSLMQIKLTFSEELASHLIEDIQKAISIRDLLTQEEDKKLRFLFIQLLVYTENSESALKEIESYLSLYPENRLKADIHLLTALSIHNESCAKAANHLEKILSFDLDISQQFLIHLELFNLYTELLIPERAAEHLFRSFSYDPSSLQEQNLFWLSNFYYEKAKENCSQEEKDRFLKHSSDLLDYLLAFQNFSFSFVVEEATVFLEDAALEYSEILALCNDYEKQAHLLETLAMQQQKKQEIKWRFKRETLFQLARTYEHLAEQTQNVEIDEKEPFNSLFESIFNRKEILNMTTENLKLSDQKREQAWIIYNFLIEFSPHAYSYITSASILQRARLKLRQFEHISKEEEVNFILSDLKELQIRKKLPSEPIHLEAALEYVDLQAKLASDELKTERALFFFKRLKEDFTSQTDLISKDYQASRKLYLEKDLLVSTYLTYVDAEILYLESLLATKAQEHEVAQDLEMQSKNSFEHLASSKSLTPYLENKVREKLKVL